MFSIWKSRVKRKEGREWEGKEGKGGDDIGEMERQLERGGKGS